jgi:Ca2+-binding EF-hand superfamily protein
MALSPVELEKWMVIFQRFDRDKLGAVSLKDIFLELEEQPNEFFVEVFKSVDAVHPDTGLIEYGDFIRAFGTYCFFGREEILR